MGIKYEIEYFTPEDLVIFYKKIKQQPSVAELANSIIRYNYTKDEIKTICEVFNLRLSEVKWHINNYYVKHNPLIVATNNADKVDNERLDKAWQHISLLHYHSDHYGYVVFGTPKKAKYIGDTDGMWQLAINKKDLTKEIVSKILTVDNVYVSVNTSKTHQRTNADISDINALYLDIDGIDDKGAFIDKCIVEGRFDVLEPSKIIATGGGLHFYFKVVNAYNNKKLTPFISRLQKQLHELYPEADKLSDLARFLRLEGSTYFKNENKKIVESIYNSDLSYTVKDLGDVLLPAYQPKVQEKAEVFALVTKKEKNEVIKVRDYTDSAKRRIDDFDYLLRIGHFDDDRRKTAVFLYGVTVLQYTNSFKQAAQAMIDFNMALSQPLEKEEMYKHITSIRKNGFKYNYSTKRLELELELDKLSKSDYEGLQQLNDAKNKQRNDIKRNEIKRESRRNKKGLTQREQAKQEKLLKIKTLLEQGLNTSMIADELQITKRYVNKIIKENNI